MGEHRAGGAAGSAPRGRMSFAMREDPNRSPLRQGTSRVRPMTDTDDSLARAQRRTVSPPGAGSSPAALCAAIPAKV